MVEIDYAEGKGARGKELGADSVSRSLSYPIIVDIKYVLSKYHIRAIGRTNNGLDHELANVSKAHGDFVAADDVPDHDLLRKENDVALASESGILMDVKRT